MKMRTLLCLLLGILSTLSNAASWQLPSGYYVPAKMPMTVVNPRPDSETPSWARQRLAYADGATQYRIPIAIQGGAYPFYFQLTQGPAGMAVGQQYGVTDYGIVTWTPTAAQISNTPYPVTVNITDQDGNTITASWSVTATTSGFVFVDPNASTGGDGSKAKPFNSTVPLFVEHTSNTPSPYAHDIVYFRSGITTLIGAETAADSATGNVQLQNNLNPSVWLGYPGENATLDFSHSKVLIDSNQNDVWVSDLNIANARTDVSNYHFFYFSTNSTNNRTVFFENHFKNIGYNSAGSDPVNQACILMFNPGVLRKYFTFMGNTLDQFQASFLDVYAIKYAVIENNQLLTGIAPSPETGFYLKSDLQYFSVRHNTSLTQTYGYGAIYIPQQAQIFTNANLEFSYNLILSGNISNPAIRYEWMGGAQPNNSNPQIYIYRNTLSGAIGGLDDFPYTVYLEKNVMINSAGNYGDTTGTYRIVNATDNLTGTPGTGIIDTNGLLTGSYASYRGTHGFEIPLGINPLSAPTWQ